MTTSYTITSRDAPRIKETQRPWRIWDARERKYIAHRCYATERRALDSALLLVRWGHVGHALEVLDVRTARFCAAYVRKVSGIQFATKEA